MSEDFTEAFISEAEDIIESLNEDLLILEKSQEKEVIDKLFRSFHTLKGNAATMGFTDFSKVAHGLEDVLDGVRNGKFSVDGAMVDMLLEGTDVLKTSLEGIRENHADATDGGAILDRVEKYLKHEASAIQIPDFQPDLPLSEGAKYKQGGRTVYRILLVFDAANPLRLAKAQLVMRRVGELGTVIQTQPAELKSGVKDIVELDLATAKSMEDVKAAVGSVSGFSYWCVFPFGSALPDEFDVHRREGNKQQAVKRNNDSMEKIQSVKVDIKRLDKLLNFVGELLISKMRLETLAGTADKEMHGVIGNVDRLIRDIQDEVMSQRMIPIGQVFNRFPRLVRDLAKHEGKDVELIIEGGDLEFDRTVLDAIADPLVHMLRNSVDHGIEAPQQREAVGKQPKGTIRIVAERQRTKAVIKVIDDGQGIDAQKVKRAVLAKGLYTEDQVSKMSDLDLQLLVFKPKVSTNEVVTEVSGRGVGMDVVMNNVQRIGGIVKLDSVVGRGTEVSLHLPLSMAIVTVLMVEVSGRRFAIPVSNISRIVDIGRDTMKEVSGGAVFLLDGQPIRFFYPDKELHVRPVDKDTITTVVIESDEHRLGFGVDSVVSQQQILIKSLDDRRLRGMKGVGGAAILGDGTVALVIDVNSVISGS